MVYHLKFIKCTYNIQENSTEHHQQLTLSLSGTLTKCPSHHCLKHLKVYHFQETTPPSNVNVNQGRIQYYQH